MTTLDVYISLNSPWALLGWRGLRRLIDKHRLAVTVKPAKFAEVFASTGGLVLAQRSAQRRAYRMMELKRWRDVHGLPMALEPKSFPSDESAGARLVIAAAQQGLDSVRLAEEIGTSLWVHEEAISDPSVLAAAATRAGLDAAAIMAAAPPAGTLDAAWQANTDEAVARGVFGAPSYVLPSGEIFWGQDRVELLGWRLAQGG